MNHKIKKKASFPAGHGKKSLTNEARLHYIDRALTKSASRDKLNKHKANNSAPKCAFFVPDFRTPQEIAYNGGSLSMVGRNGQPLAVGCVPCVAVCHPVTSYRPTVTSLAVVPKNSHKETTQMYQFIFAAIRRTDLTNRIRKIRIIADSETQARAKLAREFVLVFAGKIRLKNGIKTDRTLTQGLPSAGNKRNIAGTTNQSGSRSRYSRGIFLPENHTIETAPATGARSFIDFAVRATPKNKAEFIRTNNGGCSLAVVEPLSHPSQGDNPLLTTKEKNTMKTQSNRATVAPENYPKFDRTLTPGLPIAANRCNIDRTIDNDGSRSRYSSGIFLPQIYTSQGGHRPKSIEFAVQMISRNKAYTRTNKASRSLSVVESVPHPITGGTLPLTKNNENTTMKTQSNPTALCAAYRPVLPLAQPQKGGCHA